MQVIEFIEFALAAGSDNPLFMLHEAPAARGCTQSLALLKQADNSTYLWSLILQECSPQALKEMLEAMPMDSIGPVQLSVEEGECASKVFALCRY